MSRELALLARLAAFSPDGPEEDRHTRAIRALLVSHPGCFDRGFFSPGHITASAFVLCDTPGRVLLHHHRRLGRWLQLGGHVEPGDVNVESAALREAREESGLPDLRLLFDAPFDLDIHEIPAARGEPSHLHHDIRFLVGTRTPEALRLDLTESKALSWFTPAEATEKMAGREGEPGALRAFSKIGRYLDRR